MNKNLKSSEKDIARHLMYIPDAIGTVRALGIDTYPGEMAIVRELVQNADDAFDKKNKIFPTYISFNIKNDELIIEHNGKPFSKPPAYFSEKDDLTDAEMEEVLSYDFAKISKIGLGKIDEEMTGKFGTGFTSVFHITDNPRIMSNGWDFEIRIGRRPIIKEIPQNKLTFVHLPFRVTKTEISSKIGAEIFDENKQKKFEEQIFKEIYKIIFFLKNIKKIKVLKNNKLIQVSEKIGRKAETKIKNLNCNDVTISMQNFLEKSWKDPKEKWSIYSLENIPIPQEFKDLGLKLRQTVSIAISKEKCKFADKFGILNYSYFTLPIKETEFQFKYNTSKFFTTTDRTDFITKEGLKNAWNKWQIENLANLLIKTISELIITKKNSEYIYQILPHRHVFKHDYDKYLIDIFREKVQEGHIKIFYTTKKKWVRANKNVYIGDKRLEQILPKNSYPHFIDPKHVKKFKDILEFYGALPLSKTNFIEYLEKNQNTKNFRNRFETKSNKEKIEKVHLIYEYLKDCSLSDDEIKKLKTIAFILTEDGTLRDANYGLYFPSDEDMPLIQPDDIVHKLIYNSKKSKSFLRDILKIKTMKFHDLIVDSFLRRLGNYDENQKFKFTVYIVKRKKEVVNQKDILERLNKSKKEFLKLEINNVRDGDVYFYDEKLKQVFENRINYLSQDYERKLNKDNPKWKDFFKKIGIKEIPTVERINSIVYEISIQKFSNQNSIKAERLFRLIDKYLKKLPDIDSLRIHLNNYRWLPTTNNNLEYPSRTYVSNEIAHLVGDGASIISFPVKRNDPLVQLLKMPIEAGVTDVVNYLLNHNSDINKVQDRKVDFRIYQYLNEKAKELNEELVTKLKSNRIIWFKKLWYTNKLFLKNQSQEFGPNGEIRGYIYKNKIKDLTSFCTLLGIKNEPAPADYVNFLIDISYQAEKIDVVKWKKYIENAHFKIACSNLLSEEQKESLRRSKIIIFNSSLKYSRECYLIRKTDGIYKDKIKKSGIIDVPFVEEKQPVKERFYLSIGVNEIYDNLSQERIDEDASEPWVEWKEKLDGLIPWIKGYSYYKFDYEDSFSLDTLEGINVQKVSALKVLYGIKIHNGEIIKGNPVEDICCLEICDDGKSNLYLDKSFDENKNEHITFLSALLTTLIQDNNVDRVDWILFMSQYFKTGEISGVNPYYPMEPVKKSEKIEGEEEKQEKQQEGIKKEPEEKGESGAEEKKQEEQDEDIKEEPEEKGESGAEEKKQEEQDEDIKEEPEEKGESGAEEKKQEEQDEGIKKEPEEKGESGAEEKKQEELDQDNEEESDDGLNESKKHIKPDEKRKIKYPAPKYRGGGHITPHAINYDEERNWVRAQANGFCQICGLFCESCGVKNVEKQCPCEIRKNSEKALVHHHLEAFERDPTKDVRGNLVVLCQYHHNQLHGTNIRLGYLNNKIMIDERKDDFILTVYPKNKDEVEIKIRLSKEHFYEFQNYVEKRKVK